MGTDQLMKGVLWFVVMAFLCGCFLACNKKPVPGCMDRSADNFNFEATQNCCCEYTHYVQYLAHQSGQTSYLVNYINYNGDTGVDIAPWHEWGKSFEMKGKTLHLYASTHNAGQGDTAWLKILVDDQLWKADTVYGANEELNVGGIYP